MFEPFTYNNLEDLQKKIRDLNLSLPLSDNVKILKQPLKFKNILIPNRLSIQPMEGFDAKSNGTPSELTLRRYKRYAKGGAGLIWFEATSITEESRSNPHQLMLTQENYGNFRDLVLKVREISNKGLRKLGFSDDCVLILQLNHSGRYSKKNGKKYPVRVYDNQELDNAINVSKTEGMIITDEELENLEKVWIEKARLAKEAGFNGVDIKACHGYLISELLNSFTREQSEYGGPYLKNRSLFFKNVLQGVKKESRDLIITTRLGVYDGIAFPYGFGVEPNQSSNLTPPIDLTEPIQLIKELNKLGIDLFNITAGNPHYKPFITRPYDKPVIGGQIPPEHPLVSVDRILNLAAQIKDKIKDKIITVSSGLSYLREYAGFVASGLIEQNKTDICGFGRMAIANPEFPIQLFQKGIINKKDTCISCSKCSQLMRNGKNTGCTIRDPLYKEKI
ncbi:MAG: flavin oxidoreductase/NADH oxidase [Candidatus Thorarchaeota archaeon]